MTPVVGGPAPPTPPPDDPPLRPLPAAPTRPTPPFYLTATSESVIMSQASSWLASGVMGRLKRMNP